MQDGMLFHCKKLKEILEKVDLLSPDIMTKILKYLLFLEKFLYLLDSLVGLYRGINTVAAEPVSILQICLGP